METQQNLIHLFFIPIGDLVVQVGVGSVRPEDFR